MKRLKFIQYLVQKGCSLVREGAKHSVYENPTAERISTVPRHAEVNDFLAIKICKDLDIPPVRPKK